MSGNDGLGVSMLILRVATQVMEGIDRGLATRGFGDVRPMHGFAFVMLAAGPSTVAELAVYLGITKQAASQLVEQLVQRGYVTREDNPRDGRAWLLRLTDRGRACTRAAEEAASEVAAEWGRLLGPETFAALRRSLDAVVTPGRLRPAW
jgi:DNA-binding MarR family transcriptional regulator